MGRVPVMRSTPSLYAEKRLYAVKSQGQSVHLDIQANVGLVQSNVTSATTQMSLQVNLLTTQIGNLESVDLYEVATRISSHQTQIATSYSLTSQLQRLSLVEYL
jgi:flagellar hook-associated protein 3 FlgL